MEEPILQIENLHTSFHTRAGEVQAVRGLSFQLQKGEILGIVGESGSGKSVTALSILDVLPENAFHSEGKILFEGKDLLKASKKELRKVRGGQISMVFQDPMTSLSPLMKIGKQIEEAILQNVQGATKEQARVKALEMLRKVHIPDPESRYDCYPHELSGGMRQRVMIAIALSCDPKIVIADEPTTALDVTIQKQILLLLKEMCREMQLSVIFITHDLGVVAQLCDRVVVLYGGLKMEEGTVFELFENPGHPYTMGLLESVPRVDQDKNARLQPIPGSPPDLLSPPQGCPFYSRCRYARRLCVSERPEKITLSQTHSSACWLNHPEAPAVGNPFAERQVGR
ncbi:MAG: ABC transporter ATP-binding protein [Lachnospiraceae bacterium]|nr:ABC transporter ATP-binding protein [Lachnospiraceae bacterium]